MALRDAASKELPDRDSRPKLQQLQDSLRRAVGYHLCVHYNEQCFARYADLLGQSNVRPNKLPRHYRIRQSQAKDD
jgi:hypothetical protein